MTEPIWKVSWVISGMIWRSLVITSSGFLGASLCWVLSLLIYRIYFYSMSIYYCYFLITSFKLDDTGFWPRDLLKLEDRFRPMEGLYLVSSFRFFCSIVLLIDVPDLRRSGCSMIGRRLFLVVLWWLTFRPLFTLCPTFFIADPGLLADSNCRPDFVLRLIKSW